jgi:hypothetical protein
MKWEFQKVPIGSLRGASSPSGGFFLSADTGIHFGGLWELEEQLTAKGFKVESHVRWGIGAEEILIFSDQEDIDLWKF